MKILVNASNLGPGGASQVADSICRTLGSVPEISFVAVLPQSLDATRRAIEGVRNVKAVTYTLRNGLRSYLLGRDRFLDRLVESEGVDMVLSVFGPTWWTPRRPHLCGFALAHLVMPESPYFDILSPLGRIKSELSNLVLRRFFKRCSKYFYTENPLISKRLPDLLGCRRVFTVTNFYNQVFDTPEKQVEHPLPPFDGFTLLTVSTAYPHKNLAIALKIAEMLHMEHPEIKLRFVFTIREDEFPPVPQELKPYFLFIGKVDVAECPSLYSQADIVFQPTLLECFTATYPEAMRAGRPILTTDLEFARGLCGDAALYYNALSAVDAYQRILELTADPHLRDRLVHNGREQLKSYDSYAERTGKLMKICREVLRESEN